MRLVSDNSTRIKASAFNGSIPFKLFKFQFETIAKRNATKVIELIVASKIIATAVLESLPAESCKNYKDIIAALHRKYGGECKKEIYTMEFRGRTWSDHRIHRYSRTCNRL